MLRWLRNLRKAREVDWLILLVRGGGAEAGGGGGAGGAGGGRVKLEINRVKEAPGGREGGRMWISPLLHKIYNRPIKEKRREKKVKSMILFLSFSKSLKGEEASSSYVRAALNFVFFLVA